MQSINIQLPAAIVSLITDTGLALDTIAAQAAVELYGASHTEADLAAASAAVAQVAAVVITQSVAQYEQCVAAADVDTLIFRALGHCERVSAEAAGLDSLAGDVFVGIDFVASTSSDCLECLGGFDQHRGHKVITPGYTVYYYYGGPKDCVAAVFGHIETDASELCFEDLRLED